MKYFTADEIGIHNCAEDCWVSIYDNVYEITSLIQENKNALAQPLIKAAGRSISNWFTKNYDVKTHIDPTRNILMPYTPEGRFLHIPPDNPAEWSTKYDLPWWKDPKYIIGRLSRQTRSVKIINMLTHQECMINTCSEETVRDIQARYQEFNKHAESYTWKALQGDEIVPLNLSATLEENNISDESEKFYRLGMNDDFYTPTLLVYFNDDLTYA